MLQKRMSDRIPLHDPFVIWRSLYAAAHPGVSFTRNFASSGALAKQVAAGAPVDLFISANPKWMDYLVKKQIVPSADVQTFAFNALVFVGESAHPVHGMQDLSGLGRIAIGSPASVPAGQYARQALTHAGLYDGFLKANKLVMAKDVRQALVYADRGETDGAFVYKTDALLAKNAKILFQVPQKLYHRVVYPMGLTVEGTKNPDARGFFTFLGTPEAKKVLAKYGFVTE
ncbi:MAG: molybdate ABC transporter substrate-binding protein [Desulfuromonadales bacterium]